MIHPRNFLPILAFLILSVPLAAQVADGSQPGRDDIVIPPEKANPVVVPFFDEPPVIDGRLDEDVWKRAATFKDFIQTEPGDLIPPSKETIAYMGYDSKNLYIAYFCFDEPDKIRATVAKRDAVGGEDYVGVFLDTFNDQRRAYILQFNPFGIQADGIKTVNDFQSDFSVDIVMESKGVIVENGWSVEVRIPFKSLRYEAGEGKMWGVDFWRRIDRLNREIDGWMPMKKGVNELVQLGRITGLTGIDTERTIEIVPSVTVSQSGRRIGDPDVPGLSLFDNGSVEADVGVSVKFQVTPNVTLDLAVNPDFAEVEADAPVVRANERFPIFFPEKRPFFLEGREIFNSPLQVVNTRNIADPDVAAKVTGKIGKNTFGVMTAVDRFPNTDTRAYVGVLRLKRDILENSSIGIFATQYNFGADRKNTLGGFDGKIYLDSRTFAEFQAVFTHTRGFFYNPENDTREFRSGNGVAYRQLFDYTGRNRGWSVEVSGRSKDYRADVGFTRRTNTHGGSFRWRLGTEPKPENTLIGITTRGSHGFSVDESGRLQGATLASVNTNFKFQNQLDINVSFGSSVEKIYEDEFGPIRSATKEGAFVGADHRGALQWYGEANIGKTFSKRFSVYAEAGFSQNALDLDFGASEVFPRVSPAYLQYLIDRQTDPTLEEPPLDPGKAFLLRYELGINLQPTDPWSINLSYNRQRLTRNDTDLVAFDSHLVSARTVYQFTRFTFARVRWDYDSVRRSLNGQMLFGWSPNPGTAFYVGYNDNLFYKGFNPFTGMFDDGLRRDGRSFFVRASYLFRKSF
ncbi:MAG: carbohydrate binding family 9 domain-containing protein [Acidobacteriota bacterium]|nr:MAG: carbohydrate binding family 9 domain-containing protein [Acidobacteriota bacterium]